MPDLETLTIDDIMRIFRLSRNSIYLRLRDAREGRGGLPLPIPTGAKRRLRWNAETVRNFLQSAETPQPSSPPVESETKRATRHRVAMKKLEKFGIKIPQKEQEE